MSEEEKITISVNQEDVQNIINAYEKDIKLIEQLQQENNSLRTRIKTVKRNRKKTTAKVRKLREEITIKNKSLEIKNKRIKRVIEYIENTRVDNNYMVQEKYEYIIEILKGANE